MGVMQCSRNGCNGILCDTYIPQVGYICPSCQEEFKKYLEIKKLTPSTEGQIISALKDFMETPKGYFSNIGITVDEFFNKHT